MIECLSREASADVTAVWRHDVWVKVHKATTFNLRSLIEGQVLTPIWSSMIQVQHRITDEMRNRET